MSVDAYLTHTMNHIISTFIQRPELQSVVPNFAIVNAEHLYVGYIQMWNQIICWNLECAWQQNPIFQYM